MSRPLLLDLFCGAGGAAMGYHRAGFDIIGVDITPQPNYPYTFIQADALEYVRGAEKWGWLWANFDIIHASPPCQRYSDLAKRNGNGNDWPDLIAPTRELLRATGLPYVIENVEGAPLIMPITLCGTMFPGRVCEGCGGTGDLMCAHWDDCPSDCQTKSKCPDCVNGRVGGLRVIRHRLFESNVPLDAHEFRVRRTWALPHGRHPLVFTHDKRKAHYGQLDQDTSFVQVTGGGNATVANKRAAMGIDWMTGSELNEAIPPAYTEFIGTQLLATLRST